MLLCVKMPETVKSFNLKVHVCVASLTDFAHDGDPPGVCMHKYSCQALFVIMKMIVHPKQTSL